MNAKAIRAAAKEIERHKFDPWTDTKAVEIARAAVEAYERTMWKPIEEAQIKHMTTRRIVPAEATEEMLYAINVAVAQNDDAEHVFDAMLAASPASGKVSEAEVEKSAEAMKKRWHERGGSDFSIEDGLDLARAALASLGLEVE